MKPENVNRSNFKVIYVVYNKDEFSVAYGKTPEDDFVLGMRWNGNDADPGYPKLFNYPVWFFVAENLKIPTLKSLYNIEGSNNELILKSLENELNSNIGL